MEEPIASEGLLLPGRDGPDIAVLKRQDGPFVAAFSARGATKEGMLEAYREDYRALLEEHPHLNSVAGNEKRGA